MFPPADAKTAQGYELQMGVNCLGHFLFAKLLTPTLVATAKTAVQPGDVRVVWVSSSAAELLAPTKGGVDMTNLDFNRRTLYHFKYGQSKAGNYYHATEFAKQHKADGIISVVS